MLLGGRRLLRDSRANLNGQEAGAMVSRNQFDRFAARIDVLALPMKDGSHIGVVWRMPDETDEEARRRHSLQYPSDAVETMLVVGWEPMTREEWAAKYCTPTAQG